MSKNNQDNQNNTRRTKLDFKIEDQQERIKLTQEILYDKDGWLNNDLEKYFSEQYNPVINKSDSLDYNKKHRMLQSFANYIIYSPGAERLTKRTTYNIIKIYNIEKEIQNTKKIQDYINKNILDFKLKTDIPTNDEVIHFLKTKNENYKKSKEEEINEEDYKIKFNKKNYKSSFWGIKQPITITDLSNINDLNDYYKCEVNKFIEIKTTYPIKEYQKNINKMRKELNKLRKKRKNKKKQESLEELLREYKNSQFNCKEALLGKINFKNSLIDSTVIDYDQFDFFDKEHVMTLLKCKFTNITTDLGLLVYDLNCLLERIKLTNTEKEALIYYRESDLTQESIGKELNMARQSFWEIIDRICDKIIDKYEDDYEDWYYLNVVKGSYKKCSKCGKIKIANERHFSPDKTRKDGFYPYCKKCRQKIEKVAKLPAK